ncbi:MAG: metal-dependent transcriptional regulator [Caldilineales bacterium]|nr:metal-dependent transcriptional regulator [Caldilineales bacterium]MDW8317160.1 metal-dependent transcriptional regulator [Anaerolineae bacterium]
MSESTEMYLLRIALLQDGNAQVPISTLADQLSVSPVSANQMCRRLASEGLVIYQPYKGVSLTAQGEKVALRILRNRRLWEVFLVEKLHIEPKEAEEMACRLEHVTPGLLSRRLAEFLGNPTMSPQREPIPPEPGEEVRQPRRRLTTLIAGQEARITGVYTDETVKEFLRAQGVAPGALVKVVAGAANGSMLLEVSDDYVYVTHEIAAQIEV